jgi:hypothetical protein
MQPRINDVQGARVIDSKPQVGPTETQWKGRVFSLNFIDVQARWMNEAALIMAIAGVVLCLTGFVSTGIALGVLGAFAAIGAKLRKFSPDEDCAYKCLAIKGQFGSDRVNPFKVNHENKEGTISIHLNQKVLDEAILETLLVGEVKIAILVKGVHRGDVEEQLFIARVSNQEKQIKIFPGTLEASRFKYNVTVDNVPINVVNEAIPCYANDRVKYDNFEYKYDFIQLYVR